MWFPFLLDVKTANRALPFLENMASHKPLESNAVHFSTTLGANHANNKES